MGTLNELDELVEYDNENDTELAMRMESDLGTAQTYYLHHQTYFRNVDDEEQTSQWVLSLDAIEDEIAWCYQDDLTLCVEGQWEVTMQFNDTVAFLFDGSMSVSNKQCSMNGDDYKSVDPPTEMNLTGVIAAI